MAKYTATTKKVVSKKKAAPKKQPATTPKMSKPAPKGKGKRDVGMTANGQFILTNYGTGSRPVKKKK